MDTAVGVVKAYLELCGYFVLAQLPVRAAGPDGYYDVTDLDFGAVRFPHAPVSQQRPPARPLDVFLDSDPALESFTGGVDLIVGEVKEGQAQINRALRRRETIAFALRRIGCCPEAAVDEVAQAMAQTGQHEMGMPGGQRCRVRLVVFAGHGTPAEQGIFTLPLAHCSTFIACRLRAARDVLAGAHFKDPVLGLFALQDKLAYGAHARYEQLVELRAAARSIS